MFETSSSLLNFDLPTPECITIPLVLYSSSPAFASSTAFLTFVVTVPSFGFGIKPLGPSTWPSLPTLAIISGVAIHLSKSVNPPCTFSTNSSPPIISAPASLASSCLSALANTQTLTTLPKLLGNCILPLTFCSPFLGSTFTLIAISIVSSNFAVDVLIATSTPSSKE